MRIALALCVASAAVAAAAPAATGPTATAAPSVSGTLQQGAKLTGTPGNWLGSGTIGYAYQWYRCDARGAHCNSIHGATTSTYTEVARDVGRTIGLTVRATDGTGTTSAYASLAGPVAPARAALAARRQPALVGSAVTGKTLTAAAATWTRTATPARYGWLRCNANGRACVAIAGAIAPSYVLDAADVGHVVVATETASAAGATRSVLSIGSAPVRARPGPVDAVTPTVSGELQQGRKLTAAPGTWIGTGAIAYAYQWYRCDATGGHCSAIGGATAATYTPGAKDTGATIGLTVTATDATGKTPAYASLAGPIAGPHARLVATSQPALTGTAAVDGELAVGAPTWSRPVAASTTDWLRCNANGRACAPIAGATGGSYAPTAADAGRRLVARIVATAGAARQTTLSLESAIVAT
ncbi:MAG TPA: hypothetical protein VFA05_09360 [Gaiellaceae bacterium]|nr:hypothetical protein [Gaiellaceae bacterium]